MSQLTLPRLARKKRRELAAEAAIPCATTHTPQASHLTGDRLREPTFDDLIAGNKREPTHTDLLAADEDEDDQDLKPAARELPIVYPGVSAEALAWLREQDQPYVPNVRDEHAFDVNRLVPGKPLRRTIDLAQLDTSEAPPTMPAGNPQLLFDALDALDRLPALYAVDAASFEMAASIAAIQTYTALRPDLLHKTPALMTLAPLAALLKLAKTEQAQREANPVDHAAQLAEAWTAVNEAHTRLAVDDFVPDNRFYTALELDALDALIEKFTDAACDVRGVFDAEADDIELLAIEAGLPPLADWERELLALPEGEPDPGAERAFADMNATADAEDAQYDEIEALLNDGLEEWLAAEDGDEDHFTRAQMDGEACTVCGCEFTVGQPTVPSAYDLTEGQLFAHAACVESEASL